MNEISTILSQRLVSQTKVSLESTQQQRAVEITPEIENMGSFELELGKVNHALTLATEIRQTLESALNSLNPES